MQSVEKEVEVNAPIRAVYNQWTQFEDFPRFMPPVKAVTQIDDTHVHFNARFWGGIDQEWDAEITEQEPDKRISWRSTTGTRNAGTVRFYRLEDNRTRVRLTMAYDPEGVVENLGDKLGILSSQVQQAVEGFKHFIEGRGDATGAWRGQVHGSHAQGGQTGDARQGSGQVAGQDPWEQRPGSTNAPMVTQRIN
jgi:uncharacterized membrane protein